MAHTDPDPLAALRATVAEPPAGDPNLFGATQTELQTFLVDLGQPAYRGRQIFRQLFTKRVADFDDMTDLPKPLRANLADHYTLELPKVTEVRGTGDGTTKFLLEINDSRFEAVFIPEVAQGRTTNTLCVSSQTGCAVGCKFCFTASLKRHRNLSSAEIVGQILAVQRHLSEQPGSPRITNIVFMGMGEPLLNFENVVRSIEILVHPEGPGFSTRRVTVSTAGIVPRIQPLGERVPVQLAISLNATTDDVRDQIMPINRKWPIKDLLAALHAYPLPHRRRFTIEYVLLRDLNDSIEDAERLAILLRGIPSKVNLLPLNPHDRTPYESPEWSTVERFQQRLHERGIHALVRRPRGRDVAAACGQLGGLAQNQAA